VIVRVPGDHDAKGHSVWAYTYVDLRFSDGHHERWIGTAASGTFASTAELLDRVEAWGAEVIEEFGSDLSGDLRMSFDGAPAYLHAPVEVFVEWNCELDPVPGVAEGG
jgi:hypothetical protein